MIYDTYRARAGESFDLLALAIYGDEKYAAELMSFNPDHCGLTVFSGGETLKLPVLDIPANNDEAALANTIAPWRT